ncbi:MAG: glycoside hydrolase family 99-like domain-containing protein [Paludibacteraceae bacterium]|nr:glycoside hydrolase family 99-like domain-containing protein [Paludibacteraceae bacterium]
MSEQKRKARVIAFYLPQFHPIPENDKWWGKGFTEWTNVGKAKPLFKGHYQPRVPADLGYYDLRMPEVREAQADMAREAGIEGFCYWHYWFGNDKMLLERPFKEVLESGNPDFPFCLGWANHSWTNKTWEVGTKKVKEDFLMQMHYSVEDYIKHFDYVLPAFKDKRYICVDGKPLFLIFRPLDIPSVKEFIDLWQQKAKDNGLKGIHFVGISPSIDVDNQKTIDVLRRKVKSQGDVLYPKLFDSGFDAVNSRGVFRAELLARSLFNIVKRYVLRVLFNHFVLAKMPQREINKFLYDEYDKLENVYPTLLPNWDRSARSGKKARIYVDSTPKVFKEQLITALDLLKDKNFEHKILFLQSWNEWAEGNYVEPDLKYGRGFLDVIKDCILE